MKSFSIPKDLNLNSSAVSMYNYHSQQEVNKQLVNLTQHTFSFLINGSKEIITHTNSLQINSGNFLLMKSGNCLMTEKLSPAQKNYQSFLLFFSNDLLLEFIRKHHLNTSEKNDIRTVFHFKQDEFIKTYLESLMGLLKLPVKVQTQIILLKLEELLLYLTTLYGSPFLFSILEQNNHPEQNLTYIVEHNKYRKLSLKELAFLTNMSISTFKREFEKQYKESPIKWFQEQRLEFAATLLTKERKRASDIYLEVGYENLSSFIKAFKEKYGQTPKQFQEN